MGFPYRNVDPTEQRELSFRRLVGFIQEYVYPYSPYYRRLMDELGLRPDDIRSYVDFRRIPVTTKGQLSAALEDFTLRPALPGDAEPHETEPIRADLMEAYRHDASRPGVRDLFGLRSEAERVREQFLREWQPIHFQMSGGTTGRSVRTGYTMRDLEVQFKQGGAWWYALNGLLGPEDKVLNLLPAAPHLGIYATLIVPLLNAQPNFNTFGGKVMPTERQIEIAAEERFAAIIAIPSYLTHWLRTARRMRDENRTGALDAFRVCFCVGEPITDAYRELLREQFAAIGSPDVAILEGMSSTELRSVGFYECAEGSKLHLDPENFFCEILDPETKEPVPDGEPGVFVWSHIDWRGTVILRYWTGDYVAGGMVSDPCPHCRLTIPRLRTPIWRADRDSTKIRGARVEYLALQEAIRATAGVKTFQARIRKADALDPLSRDVLEITIACDDNTDTDRVVAAVERAVVSATEITPDDIRVSDAAEIEKQLFAAKLKAEWIVDERPG
jgi:phenylacetate-coenzyme A ligase PaaK-like adenylate-forming protein